MGQSKPEEKPAGFFWLEEFRRQNSRNYHRWKMSGKFQEEDSQIEETPNSDYKTAKILSDT